MTEPDKKPAITIKDNIIDDNTHAINTETNMTPQVLRRLSAKRKIKRHAELAAARRKNKTCMSSSSSFFTSKSHSAQHQ